MLYQLSYARRTDETLAQPLRVSSAVCASRVTSANRTWAAKDALSASELLGLGGATDIKTKCRGGTGLLQALILG